MKGDGYVILKGLFAPDDIKHARETILYLIGKQGAKATHFQVKNARFGHSKNNLWDTHVPLPTKSIRQFTIILG